MYTNGGGKGGWGYEHVWTHMGKRWFVMLRAKLEKDFVVTLWYNKNKFTYHWLGKQTWKFCAFVDFYAKPAFV